MPKIDAASLFTKTVFDINNKKVDDVQQVFANDKTGDATWVTVNTTGSEAREVFIPLDHVTIEGDEIRAPYTLESIVNSPKMVNDKNLSAEEEDELRAYYAGVRGQGAETSSADRAAEIPAARQARDADVTPLTVGAAGTPAAPVVEADTVSDPSGESTFDDEHDLPLSRVEEDSAAQGDTRGRRAARTEDGTVSYGDNSHGEASDGYSDASHGNHGATGEPLQPQTTAAGTEAASGVIALGGSGIGVIAGRHAKGHASSEDKHIAEHNADQKSDQKLDAAPVQPEPTVGEKAADVKDAAAEKGADVKDAAAEKAEEAKAKVDDAKQTAEAKAEEAKAVAAAKADELKAKAAEVKETVVAKAAEVKETVAAKVAEAKDTAAAKAAETKDTTAAKLADVKDTAAAKGAENKDAAAEKAAAAKAAAADKVETARLKLEETRQKVAPKVDDYKEYGAGLITRLRSFVSQEIQIFKDKK